VGTVYNGKIKSQWREFEFMLHQVQQATEPRITLNNAISRWDEIRRNLAECNRKRRPQIDGLLLG
jgi:hypothetical protein